MRKSRPLAVVDLSVRPVDGPGLYRPIEVAFHAAGSPFFVVDFSDFELGRGGTLHARSRTKAVWRVAPPDRQH